MENNDGKQREYNRINAALFLGKQNQGKGFFLMRRPVGICTYCNLHAHTHTKHQTHKHLFRLWNAINTLVLYTLHTTLQLEIVFGKTGACIQINGACIINNSIHTTHFCFLSLSLAFSTYCYFETISYTYECSN